MSWRLAFTCFLEEMSSATGSEGIWRIKTKICVSVGAGSGEQPVCCCSGRMIWYAEGRFGNFWRNLEGSFNFNAGDLDTWCGSERVDLAWGLLWYYCDFMIVIQRLRDCMVLKVVQRKDTLLCPFRWCMARTVGCHCFLYFSGRIEADVLIKRVCFAEALQYTSAV